MKAIYVRVSSDEQAKKGYSVQDQIALCKEKAATNEILDYIHDGYSGGFY
ncbi:Resolvase, N terminal domain [Amphibacillus marinus]|uniref:Resolvase, N terminal domain n=2 Tax=Amphibacillus marinus TaxID=872970 RepID=A0A1H8NUU6_9BACI|nr:recombinase family protein [Amphibacillus marinus]SEO33357.1 Resolvase, N terminal domain [Amphibacillus marinus]